MNEQQPDVTIPQATSSIDANPVAPDRVVSDHVVRNPAVPDAPRGLFDPYRNSRDIPWMDRSRDPGARTRARLRVELDSFPVIEGRDPTGADLDAMVGRIAEEMTEIFRREWAADTINEIREQRAAEREGRAPDPSIGPQVGPDRRAFVAQPEDLDWVFARLGREAKAGPIVEASWKRQARRPMPGRFPPPPPLPLPRPAPPPQDAPRDAVGPNAFPPGPPAFPADPPRLDPLPGFPADAPEAPALPPLIPPDIGAIGSTIVGGGFQIPADPAAPLPGFPIPDDNHPARIPVLLMAWAKGELGANGRRQLIWVDHEELKALDPRFGLADEIYKEAGRRTTKPGGAVLGTEWHHIAKGIVEDYQARGEARGVRAEVSYDQTGDSDTRYGKKGTVRVDLVWRRNDGTIIIVDLKTGGANLSADQIRRIIRNVGGGDSSRVMIYQWKP